MSRTTRGMDQSARQVSSRRWLIDGMNVIGSRPNRWWNDPDRAVRELIEELDRYAASTDEDVSVVFDRRPSDHPSEIRNAVKVIFASWRGRNAATTRSCGWWRRTPRRTPSAS
jgi:predicted RNA-binding protein with PIN domain